MSGLLKATRLPPAVAFPGLERTGAVPAFYQDAP